METKKLIAIIVISAIVCIAFLILLFCFILPKIKETNMAKKFEQHYSSILNSHDEWGKDRKGDCICVNIKHGLIKHCEKENILKPEEVTFLKQENIEIEFQFFQHGVWITNNTIGADYYEMRSNAQKQKDITKKIVNHFKEHDLYRKTHNFYY